MSESTGVRLAEHALYCVHHPEQVIETGWKKGKMFSDICPKCSAELIQASEGCKCTCKEEE